MTKDDALDRHFLNYAINLGRRGLGTTAPNPSVGAVVVTARADGVAIIEGEGTTAPGGRPHAEPQALEMAGARARGATLYVSLEPCSHFGRTPPCTNAILAAGIARVVCELTDAHPNVAGEGFRTLRENGVDVHLLEAVPQALLAHAGHIRCVRDERPFVSLKIAVSNDGRVALGGDGPTWVTGPQARARGHLLRAQADAILVGAGTLRVDDPLLTCRLPGLEARSPIPVLLDSRYSLAARAKAVAEGQVPPIVMIGREACDADLDCIRVATGADGRLDPHDILCNLCKRGITRLLIEGGPTVAGSFLDADVVDEVVVFRGGEPLLVDGMLPFGDAGLERLAADDTWSVCKRLDVGSDTMTVYRRVCLVEELLGR